jgi:rRNA-processing protein FCF1
MVLVSKPLKRVEKIESQLGKLDFLIPDIVQSELERLSQKAGPKRSLLARTALELARTKFPKVHVPHARHVDDSIIDYAITQKCGVATIDTNLRRRLISNQVLVLSLSNDNLIIANPKIKAKDHV